MIHRAVLGSFERFLGIMIENYAGRFPLWLAPEQVKVIPIGDRHSDYAKDVTQRLIADGYRVTLDARNERLNFKIREAQMTQVPYMLVLGDDEVANKTLSPRRVNGDQLEAMSLESFAKTLRDELRS